MELHILEKHIPGGYTTFGSVWKKGEVKVGTKFVLKNEKKEEIPVQSRVTAYWPDGSIKWAAHTADSRKLGEKAEIYPDVTEKESTKERNIHFEEKMTEYRVLGERISLVIPKSGSDIVKDIYIDDRKRVDRAAAVLILEQREMDGSTRITRELNGVGKIEYVSLEDKGPLSLVFCVRGFHVIDVSGEEKIPYILRIRVSLDSDRLEFSHTFLYDGDEKKDFLKGIGVRFYCPMEGKNYNRHIKFGTDHGVFHEALNLLLSAIPG